MNGRRAMALAVAAIALAVLAAEWAVFRAVAPQWPLLVAHDRGAATINAGVVVAREGLEALGIAGHTVARASARAVLPAVQGALAGTAREARAADGAAAADEAAVADETAVAQEAPTAAPRDACRAASREPVAHTARHSTC